MGGERCLYDATPWGVVLEKKHLLGMVREMHSNFKCLCDKSAVGIVRARYRLVVSASVKLISND